jgi:hypothetical protein
LIGETGNVIGALAKARFEASAKNLNNPATQKRNENIALPKRPQISLVINFADCSSVTINLLTGATHG